MAKKIIITIARQYGSAGREIGEKVAAALGIPLYDKELIKEAASKGDLNEEVLKNADEQAANSLLYTLAMGSNILGTTMNFGYKMPINDKLFILQSEVIKEYAAKGSCVIIGRCADYVLRDTPGLLRLLFTAISTTDRQELRKDTPKSNPPRLLMLLTRPTNAVLLTTISIPATSGVNMTITILQLTPQPSMLTARLMLL